MYAADTILRCEIRYAKLLQVRERSRATRAGLLIETTNKLNPCVAQACKTSGSSAKLLIFTCANNYACRQTPGYSYSIPHDFNKKNSTGMHVLINVNTQCQDCIHTWKRHWLCAREGPEPKVWISGAVCLIVFHSHTAEFPNTRTHSNGR